MIRSEERKGERIAEASGHAELINSFLLLLVTSATLVVTSALLLVTKS